MHARAFSSSSPSSSSCSCSALFSLVLSTPSSSPTSVPAPNLTHPPILPQDEFPELHMSPVLRSPKAMAMLSPVTSPRGTPRRRRSRTPSIGRHVENPSQTSTPAPTPTTTRPAAAACATEPDTKKFTPQSGVGLRRRKVATESEVGTIDKENLGRGANSGVSESEDATAQRDVEAPPKTATKRNMVDVDGARQHLGEALLMSPNSC